MARVYVGNLDWNISGPDLRDHMRQAGEVMSADMFEDSNGRSKGAAVVEYKRPEDAEAAISKLNDSELGARMIFVREDRGKGGSKGGFKGGKGGHGKGYGKGDDGGHGGKYGGKGKGKGGKGPQPSRYGPGDRGRVVYVRNLPFRADWRDLKDLFKQHGEVIRLEIAEDMDGRSRGFATVLFKQEEDAQMAIQALNEQEFQGRRMTVRLDRAREF